MEQKRNGPIKRLFNVTNNYMYYNTNRLNGEAFLTETMYNFPYLQTA